MKDNVKWERMRIMRKIVFEWKWGLCWREGKGWIGKFGKEGGGNY